MRALSLLAGVCALVVVVATHPGIAQAQAKKVQVEVQSIQALTAKDKGKAPAKLAKKLRAAFMGYQSFSVLATRAMALEKGKSGSMALPNKRSLDVTYLGVADKMLKLRVAIPPDLRTDVRVSNGGTFYQAGMKHDGGILILAIQAKTLP